jgi:hypothetical protein
MMGFGIASEPKTFNERVTFYSSSRYALGHIDMSMSHFYHMPCTPTMRGRGHSKSQAVL